MVSLAISKPQTAWNFFTTGFQSSWLDDGASLTWYLAFRAGLLAGGNPAPPQQHPQQPPQPPTPPPPPVIQQWEVNRSYNVGDIVSFQGHTYQCTTANLAESTWTPTASPSARKEIS